MSTKIHIKDIETMCTYLTAVNTIAPACEFNISPTGTQICVKTEDQGVKAIFDTNAMTCDGDEIINFCFNEVKKLTNSLKTLTVHEKKSNPTLTFNRGVLSYRSTVKFKLSTVRRDIIEHFISTPIKNEDKLIVEYAFKTSSKRVAEVMKLKNIVDESVDKVYLTEVNGKLVAEIDDKLEDLNDSSIGIPVSDEIEGVITTTHCMKLSDFSYIRTLPSMDITVKATKQGAILVDSAFASDEYYVKMKLLATTVRG